MTQQDSPTTITITNETVALQALLATLTPPLPALVQAQIIRFFDFLGAENQLQNLTRLTSAEEFFYGHLADVLELTRGDWLGANALDLGSGCGVPGLLAALVSEESRWVLVESERRKADYLSRAVLHLGLAQVQVYSGRVEQYWAAPWAATPHFTPQPFAMTVVARAVGSTERIARWLGLGSAKPKRPASPQGEGCESSTWNNLVLLKGPAWPKEWQELQKGPLRHRLKLVREWPYQVGPEQKNRFLVQLQPNR